MPASINATLGSKGLPKGGRPKNISTVSHRGGKRLALTYQGTPVSKTGIAPSKAPSRAKRVQASLSRVREAYNSPAKITGPLTEDQKRFASSLAKASGMSPRLAAAWTLREGGSGGRGGANNWLNIGVEEARTRPAANDPAFNRPGSAGKATARWLRGKGTPQHPEDTAAAGIVAAGRLAKSGASNQAIGQAVAQSGWASSGAGPLETINQVSAEPGKKPKKRDLKILTKAGAEAKPPKPELKKQPGPWAGSQKAVLSLIPKGVRAEGKGDKRTPAENASVGGASDSDHLTTNEKSYAADIPPDPETYATLRKRLGLPPASTGLDKVVKDGYEYTLIFGAEHDHDDHIHFGAEWVGEGIPPGTTLGGPSGGSGGSSVGSSGGSSGGSSSSTTSKSKTEQGPTAREKLARIRSRYGNGPAVVSVALSALKREHGDRTI